jgi:asparagine synthase (glutamine-hydrolysing)
MCGIAGFVSRSLASPIDAPRLARMRDTLLHRGPDGAGLELFGTRAGLAHRRLAILDLSPAAHQPMSWADGRFWLAFNGEIYNYRELRAELAGRGHAFRSSGDAEVLVAAFAQWGEACVERLEGMWAFAIWDARDATLFLSRDRFGIKPLYFADDGELLVFASEIRAILASGVVEPTPHAPAVADYLAPQPVGDGLEQTFFEGVRRLPPAHCLSVSPSRTRVWRYWSLPRAETRVRHPEHELGERLEAAVRSHLVSDVPIGVSLSGGLDSTSVLALAARALGPGLPAYSACFSERRWNERRFSQQAADDCKAEVAYVEPSAEAFFECMPRIAWHLEEPPHFHGVYPRWWVDERAAQDVTVLLSGQGADELLAGYTRYEAIAQWEHLAHGRLLAFARELRHSAARENARLAALALRGALRGAPAQAFAAGERLRGVPVPRPRVPRIELRTSRHALRERQRFDLELGGLPTLLRYDDRLSMAHSLECRVPFLDARLAELAFSLPTSAKIRGGWRKLALRRAMDGVLPRAVQWRRPKRPYGMPWDDWLDARFLPRLRERVLSGPAIREGWLDRAAVERALGEPRDDSGPRSIRAWRWLCLSLWLELHRELADRAHAAPPVRRAPRALPAR